ncbi:hypothetical protein BH09VER1_BH09VER1_48720 [soil metagenome]
MEHNPLSSSSGFKRFFNPPTVDSRDLRIRGIGVREIMPAGLIERAGGSEDYLIMLFHEAVAVGDKPSPKVQGYPDILMIWPPSRGQYYGHPTRRFTHSWIHCDGRRVRAILRRTGLPMATPIPITDSSRFQQNLLEIHGELVAYVQPDTQIVGNLLENCLLQLARTQAEKSPTRVPEHLLAVHRFLSAAPATPISLAEMAAMAGMSVPHFSAMFRQTFGLPPVECLIQYRLHHAARLLDNRDLTISQIAAEVGYNDIFHFSKMFKKQFGYSPRHLRQGHLGGAGAKRRGGPAGK